MSGISSFAVIWKRRQRNLLATEYEAKMPSRGMKSVALVVKFWLPGFKTGVCVGCFRVSGDVNVVEDQRLTISFG